MSLPFAAFFARVLEPAATPGKGFALTGPLCRFFFLRPATSASRPKALDSDPPPAAIGRLATLDSFARAVSGTLFGAQRGNMFADAGCWFDLGFGPDVHLALAGGWFCRMFCCVWRGFATSRPAWFASGFPVPPFAAPRARDNRLGHLRRLILILERTGKIRAGRLREHGTKLIAEHPRADLLDRALGDFPQLKGSVGKPDQPVDQQSEMFEDAFDFAVLAFAQRHRQPAVGSLHAIEGRPNARVLHTIQCQTVAQPIENGLIGDTVDADPVTPHPARRRQFKDAREAAIVAEQQKSFGIDVQPADADDARAVGPMLTQKIKNRLPPLRIALGSDETARFMEQKQTRAGALDERLGVNDDVIARLDVDRRIGESDAVQDDATIADPALSLAARTKSGPGDDLGNAGPRTPRPPPAPFGPRLALFPGRCGVLACGSTAGESSQDAPSHIAASRAWDLAVF